MMMYRLLIVDDEDVALRGLCDFVDWKSLGYEVAATAYTVDEALKEVGKGNIDAVLTDIELEDESGLDLVRRLRESNPEIRSVILTGHERFEYARSALRYDTFDFLTKPVQFDALAQTFLSLAKTLERERSDMKMKDDYLHMRRTAFLYSLATEKGVYNDEEAASLSIETKGCMLLARIRLESTSSDAEGMKAEKDMLSSAILRNTPDGMNTELFDNSVCEYSYLVYNIDEQTFIDILSAVSESADFSVHIGVSQYFYHISELSNAWQQAGNALDYCVLQHQGENIVVLYRNIRGMAGENIISEDVAMEINEALCNKDIKEIENITRKEMVRMYKSTGSLNYLYSFSIEFHIIADHFLRRYVMGYSGGDILDSIRNIVRCNDLNALLKYNREYILWMRDLLEQAVVYTSDTVCQIQTYINGHYSENISLSTLADQFFLHPNYLSRLFQEKTGHNFIDYLTQVRVEKSKRLLSDTGFNMYDISQMVGYSTPNYFSKVFKASTGMTPKQWRDKSRNRGRNS